MSHFEILIIIRKTFKLLVKLLVKKNYQLNPSPQIFLNIF